jgi:heme oxygenase
VPRPPVTSTRPDARFSEHLRTATITEHRAAEQSPLMRALLRGRLPRWAYRDLLVQLAEVYATLERAADRWADDPYVASFLHPGLTRTPAIAADLAALTGDGDGPPPAPVLPATRAYTARIETAAERPWGFLAHHYTRYLGDVSGGRAVARVLARHHGLGPAAGAAFYDFATLGDPDTWKRRYRHLLDEVPWSEAERAGLVAEARAAFLANRAVFDACWRRVTRT